MYKQKKKVWNLFKRIKKNARATAMKYFEVSLPLTVDRFHTLLQYSGFIYYFEEVLFHGVLYSGRVQLVPGNFKFAKGKRPTLGVSHLAYLRSLCVCVLMGTERPFLGTFADIKLPFKE